MDRRELLKALLVAPVAGLLPAVEDRPKVDFQYGLDQLAEESRRLQASSVSLEEVIYGYRPLEFSPDTHRLFTVTYDDKEE